MAPSTSTKHLTLGLSFLAVFLFSLFAIKQSDTGFLISTGRFIFTNHFIPTHDVFSFTASGAPFINHFWLAGLIFFLLSKISLSLVVIFPALLSGLTFLILFKTTRLRTTSFLLPLILFPIFFSLNLELWVARPQIFSFLFTSLLLYWLYQFKDSTNLWPFLILFLFWANLHAGVVLGLLILFIFFIGNFLKWYAEGIKISRAKEFHNLTKKSFWLFLLSTLITLINPGGFNLWFYSFRIKEVSTLLGAGEWQSLLSLFGLPPANLFLFLMVTTSIFFFIYWRRSKPVFPLLIFLLAILMPLMSVRHVILFSILAFPLIVEALESLFPLAISNLNKFLSLKLGPFLLYSLLILFIIFGLRHAYNEFRFGLINENALPLGAVNFIKDHNLKAPLFNIEFGGFLSWQLRELPVFIDGRHDVYRGEPINDYLTIVKLEPGWESLVNEKYKIDTFLLYPRPPLESYTDNLVLALTQTGDFSVVYADPTAILLSRK